MEVERMLGSAASVPPLSYIHMTIRQLTFLYFQLQYEQDALSTKKLCMLQSKTPTNSRVFNYSFVNLLFDKEYVSQIFGGGAFHTADSPLATAACTPGSSYTCTM